jgi:hypothetical protein
MDNKKYSHTKVIPFGKDREKASYEFANLLMSQCDSVSIKRTIKLDKISLIYAALKTGDYLELVRPDFNPNTASTYKMSQLSLNCVCGEGNFY